MLIIGEDRFPHVWVPSLEERDVRQLHWHRHRLVETRTRIVNQLQEVALNEGYNESLGSEQYQSRDSSMACRYPRWASVEVKLFKTADLPDPNQVIEELLWAWGEFVSR